MTNENLKKVSFASLLVTFGIIYGDIGTSPLYVLKAIIGTKPITQELVYGGISCIFWTLTIQTTFKYILLTLQADNHGEGGIFSLYALVKRYGKKLVIPTILGATTLLADGIITPPISVASAVEGIQNIKGLETIQTVPIVIVILSFLFFFQRFGTESVGKAFGPIMLIWFSMLFILGARMILEHPEVMKAINPYYGYKLLTHYPKGFWLLGAVFLATTGAEALYSDLGHCGRENIRITWIYVKIALLTNYFGQSAWLLTQGNPMLEGRNPFYEIMPGWFLIPGIIIATMATIIASQALISGSYTLINEAMNLNFWPRVKVRQPTDHKGQIYIPSVNNLLWFGCILMILYFRSSEHMEAAYGFSITVAMLMTTLLLSYFLLFKLKWNKYLVFAILTVFFVVEVSFFIANVAKIKERWMFLFFELGIFLVMYIWYEARKLNNSFTRFVDLGKYAQKIASLSNEEKIPMYATHLIYLTKADRRHEIEEKIIRSIFSKKPKKAEVYWFLHINRTSDPYTLNYDVIELLDNKIIKVTINIGFRIQPRTELYFKKIVKELIQEKQLTLPVKATEISVFNDEEDLKFIVLEKYLSVENDLTVRESLLLNSYFYLKKAGLSDVRAFGLDKSDVEIENIPLVYHAIENVQLARIHEHKNTVNT
ncbi:MAG: KUP/HAK/KT family potassium transporter [Cytophagaceae bacterium]|nr:KUP/HAK/KT family potassium transporter [Cytophagaceae bacterium]MBK9935973.1 KUP/HAK/KT family potassium transporter [Cytophagaceae bacterium]MBL0304144.1 KUP/HAK/KT family potassium transporter [Cytophagaceae bacterium]MBL0326953.1 KUP/HAK/KT family potassium transporter [Cytophagaceae bacterium]